MSNPRRKTNLDIFQKYTNSWKQKDLNGFLALLSKDINVTECFGAQYKGKKECESWFTHWNNPEYNSVNSWNILQDYYDEDYNMSTIEWLFNYNYKEQENQFTGITLLVVDNNKIVSIKEFESKTDTYRPYK